MGFRVESFCSTVSERFKMERPIWSKAASERHEGLGLEACVYL